MQELSRRNIALTFAGGGNRAFYQLGLMHAWGERLLRRTAGIAACSAGACVATLYLSGRETQTRRFWQARRGHVTRNIDWLGPLFGRPLAPHGPIYRDTLLCAYAEDGLDRIRAQPFPILVLTAAFPRPLPAGLGAVLGLSAYNLEKRMRPALVHPTFGRRLGFTPHVVDARTCETAEELAALVLASSSTPPFTPVGSYKGRALIDGGMVDNVPADIADELPGVQGNLVLLTRPYPPAVLGLRERRLYVAPSRPVPIERWDYTQPERLDATIEMGEAEAELHEPLLRQLLAR